MVIDPLSRPDVAQTMVSENRQISIWRRMFEALLDPRTIQWILSIGGSLSVLRLIVWLVSLGIFKNPHVLALALGLGTIAGRRDEPVDGDHPGDPRGDWLANQGDNLPGRRHVGVVLDCVGRQPGLSSADGDRVYLASGWCHPVRYRIGLSVARERLLELPERISKREGVFQILSWQ